MELGHAPQWTKVVAAEGLDVPQSEWFASFGEVEGVEKAGDPDIDGEGIEPVGGMEKDAVGDFRSDAGKGLQARGCRRGVEPFEIVPGNDPSEPASSRSRRALFSAEIWGICFREEQMKLAIHSHHGSRTQRRPRVAASAAVRWGSSGSRASRCRYSSGPSRKQARMRSGGTEGVRT
jgi:hypothetical protein